MRSIHSEIVISELLFCSFSEDQGSSTNIIQLWEVHILIIVIQNAELIGMDVFRTWYLQESPGICSCINPKKSDALEDKEHDGEIPF